MSCIPNITGTAIGDCENLVCACEDCIEFVRLLRQVNPAMEVVVVKMLLVPVPLVVVVLSLRVVMELGLLVVVVLVACQ